MSLTIGDTAPDFEADTTVGRVRFHEWIGDSWAVLFSHPKDFTPVCTTELGYMAKLKPEFDRRGMKIIGLSVDNTSDHDAWAQDIEDTQGARPNYPIIGDDRFEVSKLSIWDAARPAPRVIRSSAHRLTTKRCATSL
jgi:thioredoxin-dependent peroxiredoxin